jgi:chemotaxis protein methyltransferase CheR
MQVAALETVTRLSDRHFRSIAELVETEVGIKLPAAKRLMLEGRLLKRVRALDYSDVNEYVEQLFDGDHFEAELVHLIDCVTTNKTDFFREPSHFAFMKEVAVPEILRRRGRGTRPLKIWSAACSTGMEAYTIAMVLDDMVTSGIANFQFSVLGTDISTSVLKLAETGIYTPEMISPVPAEFARRYFLSPKDPSRDEVRVVPRLRRSTNFMRMNLMDPSYPVDRDVDIIFCRNVLIYFDKPTQQKVVEQLCTHLRPGGFFIVGHSESMIHNESAVLQQILPTIFRV